MKKEDIVDKKHFVDDEKTKNLNIKKVKRRKKVHQI